MTTHERNTLRWTAVNDALWPIYLITSPTHLVYVGLGTRPDETCHAWLKKRWPQASLHRTDRPLERMATQFREYVQQTRREFSIRLHFSGTPFQKQVWRALCDIPYGTTCTYSHIAERIGNPRAVRAVAGAIGANPMPLIVPCHRVIGKNGTLTGFGWGIDKKRTLLQLEGIAV